MSSYSLCSSRRINSFYISGGTNTPRCAPQSLSRNTPSISSIRENTFKHHRFLFNDAIREFIRRIVVFSQGQQEKFQTRGQNRLSRNSFRRFGAEGIYLIVLWARSTVKKPRQAGFGIWPLFSGRSCDYWSFLVQARPFRLVPI